MRKTILLLNTRANQSFVKRRLKSKKCNDIFILFAMPTAVHAVIATLAMPTGDAERGVRAKAIIDASAVSTWVTVDAGIITVLNAKLVLYNNATTPGTRKSAYKVLLSKLKALMALFQAPADDAPINSIAIIQSGAFGIKGVSNPQKHVFGAKNGAEPGTIELEAEGTGAHTCHDWMYSRDGITFTRMEPTVAANTSMTGLTSKDNAYFMHQVIDKTGGLGWSQIILIVVQ